MINPYTIADADICYYCKQPHALDVYDKYGNKYDVTLAIHKNAHNLDEKSLLYIKCRYCGNESPIDWTGIDNYPRQLTKGQYNHFMSEFIRLGEPL